MSSAEQRERVTWRERLRPVRMDRIALVALTDRLPETLERLSVVGLVEFDEPHDTAGAGSTDTDPHDAELARRIADARTEGPVSALLGWSPHHLLPEVRGAVEPLGASIVRLAPPAGVVCPTLLRPGGAGRRFDPLVETYGTVPYVDVDPTLVAGLAYVVMFGMMFGDVGHGLLLVGAALVVRWGRGSRLRRLRRAWPFLFGAGLTSGVFGLLYGEAFGPTGLVPRLWLDPLESPIPLLLAALGVGAVLIAGAYGLGIANRIREGGLGYALYARTGVAGSLLFLALGLIVAAVQFDLGWLVIAGVSVAVTGLALVFVGLAVTSTIAEAVVELFDTVVRLGSNIVSFARLAAFGLTHAALGSVVWQGTSALIMGDAGVTGVVAGALVFVAGNAIAFALEALVAGVQALRLEYYELFSRVFETEGRPFRPWRLPEAGPDARSESR